MTMRQFIKENRELIDGIIRSKLGQEFKINNNDRRDWIANDEVLYDWAQREGVKM